MFSCEMMYADEYVLASKCIYIYHILEQRKQKREWFVNSLYLFSVKMFANSVHRLLGDIIRFSIKCFAFTFAFSSLQKSRAIFSVFSKVLLVSSIIVVPIMRGSMINLRGSFFFFFYISVILVCVDTFAVSE